MHHYSRTLGGGVLRCNYNYDKAAGKIPAAMSTLFITYSVMQQSAISRMKEQQLQGASSKVIV